MGSFLCRLVRILLYRKVYRYCGMDVSKAAIASDGKRDKKRERSPHLVDAMMASMGAPHTEFTLKTTSLADQFLASAQPGWRAVLPIEDIDTSTVSVPPRARGQISTSLPTVTSLRDMIPAPNPKLYNREYVRHSEFFRDMRALPMEMRSPFESPMDMHPDVSHLVERPPTSTLAIHGDRIVDHNLEAPHAEPQDALDELTRGADDISDLAAAVGKLPAPLSQLVASFLQPSDILWNGTGFDCDWSLWDDSFKDRDFHDTHRLFSCTYEHSSMYYQQAWRHTWKEPPNYTVYRQPEDPVPPSPWQLPVCQQYMKHVGQAFVYVEWFVSRLHVTSGPHFNRYRFQYSIDTMDEKFIQRMLARKIMTYDEERDGYWSCWESQDTTFAFRDACHSIKMSVENRTNLHSRDVEDSENNYRLVNRAWDMMLDFRRRYLLIADPSMCYRGMSDDLCPKPIKSPTILNPDLVESIVKDNTVQVDGRDIVNTHAVTTTLAFLQDVPRLVKPVEPTILTRRPWIQTEPTSFPFFLTQDEWVVVQAVRKCTLTAVSAVMSAYKLPFAPIALRHYDTCYTSYSWSRPYGMPASFQYGTLCHPKRGHLQKDEEGENWIHIKKGSTLPVFGSRSERLQRYQQASQQATANSVSGQQLPAFKYDSLMTSISCRS